MMSMTDWVSGRVFNLVHRHNLVYNTCWEDPRLDRVALRIGPDDTVLVITSAGCNALDYALAGAKHVHAVDMNPRQNALLELKQSAIRNLDYDTFFQMFGRGRLPNGRRIYRDRLRDSLSPWSRGYWDKRIKFFCSKRRTFFFRGTCGSLARMMNIYIDRVARVRPWIDQVLAAETVEEQREIYETHIRDRFWSKPMRFLMNRDSTLSMVGVPKAQRVQVESQHDGGIATFAKDCVDTVFSRLPISDNYFWRVYINGEYTPECCPEYLKAENFGKLQGGLVDNVTTHTDTVQGFLESYDGQISRYVLLDHMDWLSDKYFEHLEAEWQAIIDKAAPETRLIWRSGGLRTDFLDRVKVMVGGMVRPLQDLLRYEQDLAEELHRKCRVHTYGSFYIAELAV